MEEIKHYEVTVNGIRMHYAEKGEGPAILFLHGFPELWYSWRHQIVALSSHGYRAIAPDLRGYGDTEAPPSPTSYTCFHIVGDLVSLIDHLRADQVHVVAHDWGAIIGWYLCLFRPDKVRSFVSLGIPFIPRNPAVKPVQLLRMLYGEDYYICRFQEAGEIEEVIKEYGVREVMKKIIANRSAGPLCLPKENAFGIDPAGSVALPSWFTEEDLAHYVSKFDKNGFTGGLNYYRALDLNWELTAAWSTAAVTVPVKFIVGDRDLVYTTPMMKEIIHGEQFKSRVPHLEQVVVLEGVHHFCNQEKPEEINFLIKDFIFRHPSPPTLTSSI